MVTTGTNIQTNATDRQAINVFNPNTKTVPRVPVAPDRAIKTPRFEGSLKFIDYNI